MIIDHACLTELHFCQVPCMNLLVLTKLRFYQFQRVILSDSACRRCNMFINSVHNHLRFVEVVFLSSSVHDPLRLVLFLWLYVNVCLGFIWVTFLLFSVHDPLNPGEVAFFQLFGPWSSPASWSFIFMKFGASVHVFHRLFAVTFLLFLMHDPRDFWCYFFIIFGSWFSQARLSCILMKLVYYLLGLLEFHFYQVPCRILLCLTELYFYQVRCMILFGLLKLHFFYEVPCMILSGLMELHFSFFFFQGRRMILIGLL